MTRKILSIILVMILAMTGCAEEELPDDIIISYDTLDLSALADEIYEQAEMSPLTRESVSNVTDETVLAEQYYLDLNDVVAYEIRSAEGKYGVADVALIRVRTGCADEVMSALENRKDDRINEFSNYDVYDSYAIAMEADIYQEGELVIMIMLDSESKTGAMEIIDRLVP